jgi:hypothetical protein
MPKVLEAVLAKLVGPASTLGVNLKSYHQMLVIQLGEEVTMGVYLCAAFILLMIAFKVFKLTIDILRFIVIPSLAVAYIVSSFFSYNFLGVAPMAGAAFSFLFLLKA